MNDFTKVMFFDNEWDDKDNGLHHSVFINYTHIWNGTPKDIMLFYLIFPLLSHLDFVFRGEPKNEPMFFQYYFIDNIIGSISDEYPLLETILQMDSEREIGYSLIVPIPDNEFTSFKDDNPFAVLKRSLLVTIKDDEIKEMFSLLYDMIMLSPLPQSYLLGASYSMIPIEFLNDGKVKAISSFEECLNIIRGNLIKAITTCNLFGLTLLKKKETENNNVNFIFNKIFNLKDSSDSDTVIPSIKGSSINDFLDNSIVGINSHLTSQFSSENERNLFYNFTHDLLPNVEDRFINSCLKAICEHNNDVMSFQSFLEDMDIDYINKNMTNIIKDILKI